MACYHPMDAWVTSSGGVVLVERGDLVRSISLPCGRCIGCLSDRAQQWAVRIMHEVALQDDNCFLTLTYDDDHLPPGGTLVYRDFRLFVKRLRKLRAGKALRYFVVGEYGGDRGRPHYHCGLFNEAFREDRVAYRKAGKFQIYKSETLSRLWPHGLHEIGELTQQSAAYMARYSLKKVGGDLAREHYGDLEPEFVHMSLRPGIGARWFARFGADVYPHDRVVVGGKKVRPPRFYDKLLKRKDRPLLTDLKEGREERARLRWEDNTVARLKDREIVAEARMKNFKRNLR